MKTYTDEKIDSALSFLRDIKKSLNEEDRNRLNVVMSILECESESESETPVVFLNTCHNCGGSFRSDSGFCCFDGIPFSQSVPCKNFGICAEWMEGKCGWFICRECHSVLESENTGD